MNFSKLLSRMTEGVTGGLFLVITPNRTHSLELVRKCPHYNLVEGEGLDGEGNKIRFTSNKGSDLKLELLMFQLSGVLTVNIYMGWDTIGVALSRMRNQNGVSKYSVIQAEQVRTDDDEDDWIACYVSGGTL